MWPLRQELLSILCVMRLRGRGFGSRSSSIFGECRDSAELVLSGVEEPHCLLQFLLQGHWFFSIVNWCKKAVVKGRSPGTLTRVF